MTLRDYSCIILICDVQFTFPWPVFHVYKGAWDLVCLEQNSDVSYIFGWLFDRLESNNLSNQKPSIYSELCF